MNEKQQLSQGDALNPYQPNSDSLAAPIAASIGPKPIWRAALLGGFSAGIGPLGSMILLMIMDQRNGSLFTKAVWILVPVTAATFCVGALIGIGLVLLRRAFVPDRKRKDAQNFPTD